MDHLLYDPPPSPTVSQEDSLPDRPNKAHAESLSDTGSESAYGR